MFIFQGEKLKLVGLYDLIYDQAAYRFCCGEVAVWVASLTFCKCSKKKQKQKKNSKVPVGDIINFISIATFEAVRPCLKAV